MCVCVCARTHNKSLHSVTKANTVTLLAGCEEVQHAVCPHC